MLEAAQEKAEAPMQRARGEAPHNSKRNRGHLPAHLPRVERVVELASTQCPCGCGEMVRVGKVEEGQEKVRGTVSPTTVRTAGRDPGAVPGAGHAPPQVRGKCHWFECSTERLPPLLTIRG